jgi:hypothetical protein
MEACQKAGPPPDEFDLIVETADPPPATVIAGKLVAAVVFAVIVTSTSPTYLKAIAPPA